MVLYHPHHPAQIVVAQLHAEQHILDPLVFHRQNAIVAVRRITFKHLGTYTNLHLYTPRLKIGG